MSLFFSRGIALHGAMFIAALLVYGLYGVPTPDDFGIIEIIVMFLLLGAIFWDDLAQAYFQLSCLAGGLFIPLLVGALYGHNTGDMLRDMAAYLILFLPLFYRRSVRQVGHLYFYLLTFVGCAFSFRTLFSYGAGLWDIHTWISGVPPDTLYLANSPEVLFTALYGIGFAGVRFIRGKYGEAALYGVLAFFPLLAMTVMMQRAGIALCAVLTAGILVHAMWICPWRAVILLAGIGLLVWGFGATEPQIVSAFLSKNEITGWNGRDREWGQVLSLVSQDFEHALFGLGWGGRFENPAVAGLEVNYTHALFSSIVLKSGFVGIFILGGAGVFFAQRLGRGFSASLLLSPLTYALVFPLILGLLLYASYKSLGFGLLILGLALHFSGEILPNSSKKLENPAQAVP